MGTVANNIKTDNKKQTAYNFFIGRGYSPQAASAAVGNLAYESIGLNTEIEGDKNIQGGSWGIAQWNGERLRGLKTRYGKDWNRLENQLDYVDWEMKNTHKTAYQALSNAKDVYSAGQAFSDLYEIPAKKYHQNRDRRASVDAIYQGMYDKNYKPTEFKTSYTPFEGQFDGFSADMYMPVMPNTNQQLSNLYNVEDFSNFEQEEKDTENEASLRAKEKIDAKLRERNFLTDIMKATQVQSVYEAPQEQSYEE